MKVFEYVLVCGGREYINKACVNRVLDELLVEVKSRNRDLVLITGGATGADNLAKLWANKNVVRYIEVPAPWTGASKPGGPMRNKWMLELFLIDKVIAFPGDTGTANMVSLAKKDGLIVETINE